jgi:hypothetical protein
VQGGPDVFDRVHLAGMDEENARVLQFIYGLGHRGGHAVPVDVPEPLQMAPETQLLVAAQPGPQPWDFGAKGVDQVSPVSAAGPRPLHHLARLVQEGADLAALQVATRGLQNLAALGRRPVGTGEQAVARDGVDGAAVARLL